jgi:two-component SAPR family response regulator
MIDQYKRIVDCSSRIHVVYIAACREYCHGHSGLMFMYYFVKQFYEQEVVEAIRVTSGSRSMP